MIRRDHKAMMIRQTQLREQARTALHRVNNNSLITREDVRRYFNDFDPVLTWLENLTRKRMLGEKTTGLADERLERDAIRHLAVQVLTLDELKGDDERYIRAFNRRAELLRQYYQTLPDKEKKKLLKDEHMREALQVSGVPTTKEIERHSRRARVKKKVKEKAVQTKEKTKAIAKETAKKTVTKPVTLIGDLIYDKLTEMKITMIRELREALLGPITSPRSVYA